MTIFELTYHRQPEAIRELVARELLNSYVLRYGKMPEIEQESQEERDMRKMERLMRHDGYVKVSGKIKQKGWG